MGTKDRVSAVVVFEQRQRASQPRRQHPAKRRRVLVRGHVARGEQFRQDPFALGLAEAGTLGVDRDAFVSSQFLGQRCHPLQFVAAVVAFAVVAVDIVAAIAIVAVMGPGIDNVMVAVSVVLVPQFARLVRASVLTVREMAYVEAARALGTGDWRIIASSSLPN